MVRKDRKKEYTFFVLPNNKKIKLIYAPSKEIFIIKKKFLSIIFDDYFYKLSPEEKEFVIWHELFHKYYESSHIFLCIKIIFNIVNASYEAEYLADKFGVKNGTKQGAIKFLRRAKILYKQGILKYNPKTHPPIEERMKRVNNLK